MITSLEDNSLETRNFIMDVCFKKHGPETAEDREVRDAYASACRAVVHDLVDDVAGQITAPIRPELRYETIGAVVECFNRFYRGPRP